MLLLILLLLGTDCLVQAQVKNKGIPFLENYTTASSSAISQTWDILQDKRGVVYSANSFGVAEFDGVNWRSIKMPNNSIARSLAMDRDGRVYVGAVDELGYLAFRKDGTLYFQSLLNRIPAQERNIAEIKDILVTSQGVWFLSSFKLFHFHDDQLSVFSSLTSYESAFLVNDELYVYEREKGLLVMRNGKPEPVPDQVGFRQDHVKAMVPFENETLVISREQGCFRYDGREFRKWNAPVNDFLIRHKINCFKRLSNGYVAFGTSLNGLLIVDQHLQPILHLNKAKGLTDNKVHSIFQDRDGNLWIGHDKGLSHLEISSPFSYYNEKIVLGMGYAVQRFGQRLYLGTSQGLFSEPWQDYQNPLTATEHLEPVDNAAGLVWNLRTTGDALLMGHEEGAFQVVSNQARKLSPRVGSWNFLELKNHPGYVLSGTYSGFLLYRKNGPLLEYVRKLAGFEESCRIVEQDEDGTLWVAHGYKGLFRMKLQDDLDRLTDVRFYDARHGFPSHLGINVYKIRNEILFTSEAGGIYKYDAAADRFVPYRRFEEWLGATPRLSKLYEDPSGNIWFMGPRRVGILNKLPNDTYRLQEKIFNKIKESMIQGFESIAPIDERNVYLGCVNGFIHFDPQVQKDVETPFRTLIRQVEIIADKDSLIFRGAFASDLGIQSVVQPASQVPEMPYALNALRFNFATPYYENRPEIRYKYFLEGFDKNWSAWTAKTEREYTNLREGTYTFRVKAQNIYEKESQEATYQFVIAPPFYRTPLAYGLYAIGIVALVALIAHSYAKRKAKALLLRQQLSEEEIIRLRNQQLQNEIEHKNTELGTLTMHIVSKNDILTQIKEKLVTIRRSTDPTTDRQIRKLLDVIDKETDLEKDWPYFELHFDKVHKDFLQKLKERYPELKSAELMLCAYIRMNLSNKEIASLMNNTVRGVEAHRYRLRKSLRLHPEDNLKEFLFQFDYQ